MCSWVSQLNRRIIDVKFKAEAGAEVEVVESFLTWIAATLLRGVDANVDQLISSF